MISEEKEAIEELKILKEDYWEDDGYGYATAECQKTITALDMAIEALEKQPCEDCISRQAVLDGLASIAKVKARSDAQKSLMGRIMFFVEQLPPVTPKEKTGYCKDCKWWKDNDGVYRRGVGAESKCPINRKEVYEGNGYCFMFEPQESEG